LAFSSPTTTGPRREIVQRVKHFSGLPHPIAGEAGELIEDARVHQWCDGAERILRGDAEFARHGWSVDDRLPEQVRSSVPIAGQDPDTMPRACAQKRIK
jgi:hypothetical protein